jgi:hypothetical protein
MLARALLSGAAGNLPCGACRECVRDPLLVSLADLLAALGMIPAAWSGLPCGNSACAAPGGSE